MKIDNVLRDGKETYDIHKKDMEIMKEVQKESTEGLYDDQQDIISQMMFRARNNEHIKLKKRVSVAKKGIKEQVNKLALREEKEKGIFNVVNIWGIIDRELEKLSQ